MIIFRISQQQKRNQIAFNLKLKRATYKQEREKKGK
jgi:hypothetical protein